MTRGTVLKAHSIRKAENYWYRGVPGIGRFPLNLFSLLPSQGPACPDAHSPAPQGCLGGWSVGQSVSLLLTTKASASHMLGKYSITEKPQNS